MIDSLEGSIVRPDTQISVPSVVFEQDYFGLLNRCKAAGFADVGMGGISKDPFSPALTFGANPCFAGVTYTKDGKGMYVFHSDERIFPTELEELIKKGIVHGGIVGGSPASYRRGENMDLLQQIAVQLIPPPEDDFQASFAVAANPEENSVYYSYNSRLYRLQNAQSK